VLIGLAGCISPYTAAIAGIATAFSAVLIGRSFPQTIATALCSGAIWAAISTIVCDIPLTTLVVNAIGFAEGYVESPLKMISYDSVEWALRTAWITRSDLPLVGIPYSSAALILLTRLIQSIRARRTPWNVAVGLIGIGLLIFFFASCLISGTRFYNVLGFFPAIVLYSLEGLSYGIGRDYHGFAAPAVNWLNRNFRAVLIAALIVLAGSAMRTLSLASASLEHGVRLSDAASEWQFVRNSLSDNERICIPAYDTENSIVVFDRPPWVARAIGVEAQFMRLTREAELGERWKYYALLQDSLDPRSIPGFTLIRSSFNEVPVVFWGVKLSDFTPGYGWALYRRVE
jgi:hypothetical protein